MINNIIKKSATKVGKGANPALWLSGATEVFNAFQSYVKVHEEQETAREKIRAERDVAVEAIREKAQLIRFALEKQFGERASNFTELFKQLDKGFENGNDKQIETALTGIVELSKISPLAQAIQATQKQLTDPNVDFVEI